MGTVFIAAGIILSAILMTIIMSKLTAKSSGWASLAETYGIGHTGERIDDVRLSKANGHIGRLNFKGGFNIGANERGVALVSSIALRAGFSTVFIPWSVVDLDDGSTPPGSPSNVRRHATIRVTTHPEFEMKLHRGHIGKSSIAQFMKANGSDRTSRS
jgi:hypothetical protein